MPNVEWTNKNTLQNLINTIHARLVKKITHYTVMPTASVDLLGEISQFIGDTDVNYTNAYFYKCVSEIDEDTGETIYKWIPVEIQNSTHISEEEDNSIVELADGIYSKAVQIEQLPIATEDNEGVVYQYVGDTTSTLTKGFFYENFSDTNPSTGTTFYEWREIQVQNIYISELPDNAIEMITDDGLYVKATQVEEMVTADEYYVDKIYQYVGATTEDYINGYFYKCVDDDGYYTWVEVKVQSEEDNHIDLTMAEYEELPDDKYTDDKVYFVTDGEDFEPTIIYGFHVDPDESDPYDKITYLEAATTMIPASMKHNSFNYGSWKDAFFMPKPCMLKSDCTVDYYLDPNDYSKKLDGSPSDVANAAYDGNAMIEWGLIWFKFVPGVAEGEWSFYVSNKQVDSGYDCPCNKDVNGDIIPHFYTSIYDGTGTTKLRSISDVQTNDGSGCGNTTGEQEVTRAIANNTTSDIEWYTGVWCDRKLIDALHFLISHSLDSQASFGMGLVGKDGDTVEGRKARKDNHYTGSLDDKGMFFGDISGGYISVKTFGMENWWGMTWKRVAGMTTTSDGYAYKMTQPYDAGGTGYTEITLAKPAVNGWISKSAAGEFGFLPFEADGSDSTYYTDDLFTGSVGNCAICGALTWLNAGCSALSFQDRYLDSTWSVSNTLSCKPLKSRF